MSSREPMWYCHECHAEMRPLMVPDPHCASCNGTFVEKIEGEVDDPRAFQGSGPALDDGAAFGNQPALDNFFANLTQLLSGPRGGPTPPFGGASSLPGQQSRPSPLGGGFRLEINRAGSGGGTRTFVLGGPPTLGRPGTDPESPSIAGPLMAQYLLSMLSQRGQRDGHDDPFHGFMGAMPEDGRWGDYVFNQEALDQIVTQIMENSNSSRPVPATDEVMEKLDRQVLEEGAAVLEKDCAVCKEQFSLASEDPDEQIVVTLPCTHPFHEGCIMPWLKSSGTCPVCRYQLVPQPEHHDHPPGGSGQPGSPASRSPPSPQTGSGSGSSGGGMFNSLFNMVGGGNSSGSSGNGQSPSSNTTSSSGSANTRTQPSRSASGRRRSSDSVPGGWWD